MTEFHHRGREAEEIVRRNYPDARVLQIGSQFVVIHEWDEELSDLLATPEQAWENALFKLTQLNAWLLWLAAGEPLFDAEKTLAFWLDAQWLLEGNPSVPEPVTAK
jgi:hypothetical protein